MTKEELKQEAEEYVCERNPLVTKKWFIDAFKKYDKGEKVKYLKDCEIAEYEAYLAGAEPREKRIAELEQENAELKNQVKTAYRKGMRHIAKALKDYDRTDGSWTDYFEHTVDKVLQREQITFEGLGTEADQLTKAKEIIKSLLSLVENVCDVNFLSKAWIKELEKAELFILSEVEK